MKELFVYILKCSDNTYYTGMTNDPMNRFGEHSSGKDPKSYTYNRRPVELVYVERFQNFHQAIDWETQIKGWSRKKKEALIQNNWEKLKEYSVCNNSTSHLNFNKEKAS